jgi:hypothetical protein
MTIQTKTGEFGVADSMETVRRLEAIPDRSDHSEIERKLIETLTCDDFKDVLTMNAIDMIESGMSNAFATYEGPGGTEVSHSVKAEPDYRSRFGRDPSEFTWFNVTKIGEMTRDDSPKKQQLLYRFDEDLGFFVPRTDVSMHICGIPVIEPQQTAESMLRPTPDLLKLFKVQNQLYPGFIGGVLTNYGKRSFLMLYKQSENVQVIDHGRGSPFADDNEDGADRYYTRYMMEKSGMVIVDIDLICPKKQDPDKVYEKRVVQAVSDLLQ